MGYAGDTAGRRRARYEVAAWAFVAGIALAMRLAQLDAAPLSAAEARQATVAWQAARGQGMPVGDYNPLLLAANSVLFLLFGASDAVARFWPALFGSTLALTPLLVRRRLGRVGALATGLYLAISPTLLVASRQLTGSVISATGAMVFVGCVARFLETDGDRWLALGAVGLALGVTSGATVYGLLLPLGLAWLVLSQLWPVGGARIGRRLSGLEPHASLFPLVVVLAALAFSTGLGWNLAGIGEIGGPLASWFGRFRPQSGPIASPITLLATYELLAVVFGVGGLVRGVRRGRRWTALLGLWAGLGLLVLMVMPSRTPADLVWAVLPLAMLTGLVAEELARKSWSSGATLCLVYGVSVLVLWGHFYLMLARYAAFGQRADLALALIAVVLQALLGLSFAIVVGLDATLRAAAAGTGIALLALTVSAGWGVAYRRPADPREALVSQPTATGVRDLVETLRDLSWQQTGTPTTLEFVFQAPPDSVLAWYLRDFGVAHRVDDISELTADEIGSVVVTTGRDPGAATIAGGDYAGQSFALRRQWTPSALGCRFWEAGCQRAFSWFLYRDEPQLPEADRWVTLWRRLEIARGE